MNTISTKDIREIVARQRKAAREARVVTNVTAMHLVANASQEEGNKS